MYLISVYFDEKAENRISGYMKQIAKYTGNLEMLDGNVPPHITIAAFRADSERKARDIFQKASEKVGSGTVQWVSVGSFLPGVIYIIPVLNEYLHRLAEIYNKEIIKQEEVEVDQRYQPFCWFPHTTLAKHLTKDQMKTAFEAMQNQFGPFEGSIIKVGLARTNPYTDLAVFELK